MDKPLGNRLILLRGVTGPVVGMNEILVITKKGIIKIRTRVKKKKK